jgi:hypothetical protein
MKGVELRPKFTFPGNHLRQTKPARTSPVRLPVREPPPNRLWSGRLCWNPSSPITRIADSRLADLIARSSRQDASFFVDTSFLRAPLSAMVWDALSNRAVHVTAGVALEIATWLASPNSQTSRNIFAIDSVLRSDRPFVHPTFSNAMPATLWFGYKYYLELLMLRKVVGITFAESFKSVHGRFPSKEEL